MRAICSSRTGRIVARGTTRRRPTLRSTALTGVVALSALLSGCASVSPAGSEVTPASDPLAVLQGTWVYSTTVADMVASGVSDAGMQDENAGTTVITIHGTDYSMRETAQAGYQLTDATTKGVLTSADGAVTLFWSRKAGEQTRFVPHREADGDVTFSKVHSFEHDPQERALDRAVFARRPWVPLSRAVEGRRTADISAPDLLVAHAPEALAGRLTLDLRSGRWSLQRALAKGGEPTTSSGQYSLQDDRLTIRWATASGATTTATVSPDPEGGLVFTAVKDGAGRTSAEAAWDGVAFGSETWSVAR